MGRAVGGRAAALLLAGRTVSRFGSSFYLVALPLNVLERTGSLGASGLFFTLTSLPPLLAVPFLGPLVERAHRKGLLILCDFGARGRYEFKNKGINVYLEALNRLTRDKNKYITQTKKIQI